MSEIRAAVTTAITVTDMASLLRSFEKIFGESYEAKVLLQVAHTFWVQSAHNRLMSTTKDTLTDRTTDATINTIRDMFPFLQACLKINEKSSHAACFFEHLSDPESKPITDPNNKPDYVAYLSDDVSFLPRKYSLINDIQPIIAEVIKAAEETAKLFSSPDKPGTQTA
jgi:hypothetical protein